MVVFTHRRCFSFASFCSWVDLFLELDWKVKKIIKLMKLVKELSIWLICHYTIMHGRRVCGSYDIYFFILSWPWLNFKFGCLSAWYMSIPSNFIRSRSFSFTSPSIISFYPSFAAFLSSCFPLPASSIIFPFSQIRIKTAVITNKLSELDTHPVGTLLCLADWS